MPAMDSSERRQPFKTLAGMGGAAFPPEPEQPPCPRCDSTNTKFCYYNNYNLSQPRHFCKACRRYWTRGGTLRNVPVGGGTRRNNKRSRIAVSAATSPSSGSSVHDPTPETPTYASVGLGQEIPMTAPENTARSFTTLLGAQGSSAFMEMGGPFGLKLGAGFEDMGLGLGRGGGFWPYQDAGIGDALSVDSHGGGGSYGVTATGGYSSWQFSGGESALADGDCFAWPDLAISMPGKGFK